MIHLSSVATMDEEELRRAILRIFSTLLFSNLRTAYYMFLFLF